jgi:hypothetical protein
MLLAFSQTGNGAKENFSGFARNAKVLQLNIYLEDGRTIL